MFVFGAQPTLGRMISHDGEEEMYGLEDGNIVVKMVMLYITFI